MSTADKTRHEVEAWLGAGHGLTDEQLAELTRLAAGINERYPQPADRAKREKALAVARDLLLAEGNEEAEAAVVRELGILRIQARQAALDSAVGLQQAALQLVSPEQDHRARGVRSKTGFAQYAGASVAAVRDWLGVPRRRNGGISG